jgi:hypothetical protein
LQDGRDFISGVDVFVPHQYSIRQPVSKLKRDAGGNRPGCFPEKCTLTWDGHSQNAARRQEQATGGDHFRKIAKVLERRN